MTEYEFKIEVSHKSFGKTFAYVWFETDSQEELEDFEETLKKSLKESIEINVWRV